jgi:hypothetical protein
MTMTQTENTSQLKEQIVEYIAKNNPDVVALWQIANALLSLCQKYQDNRQAIQNHVNEKGISRELQALLDFLGKDIPDISPCLAMQIFQLTKAAANAQSASRY